MKYAFIGGVLMFIVFNESLNSFARSYLVKGNEQIGDARLFPQKYKRIINSVCEQHFIHDVKPKSCPCIENSYEVIWMLADNECS